MNLVIAIVALIAGFCFARFAVRPMIDNVNGQQRVMRNRQLSVSFGTKTASRKHSQTYTESM